MKLSRKWLNEFVALSAQEAPARDFSEAMSVSGSKVEATEDLRATIKNVVVGQILSIDKHPDSDHMLVTKLNVGAAEPVQICTGAWNVHVGDLVPAALHNSLLPNGAKITRGKLRGVASEGMLCSLKELELTAHDFPYAVIKPAAILGDYHPLDAAKPSIPGSIAAGDRLFGSVIAAEVCAVEPYDMNLWKLAIDSGSERAEILTDCQNLHEGDMIAYDTGKGLVCTPQDLGAQQSEFPHCISDGIFILHEPCAPGDDVCALIGRDDEVVEFEITPNRPDCLCMIGLAREVAVTYNKPLKLHTPIVKAEAGGDINDLAKVIIEDPALCRRYTARMVKNVRIAPSPRWMRERIRAAGMRPINNIVDITNYVMLEYGQPMHAFDFGCVDKGEIHVRCAVEGETLRTLDGTERALTASMLCICDSEKPIGVAGVMGGANSEIVGDTDMVLFESANFSGPSVRRTATALGMRTDASSRFEKGLDVKNTYAAVQRACELIELLGAGEVVEGVIDVIPAPLTETTVKLEPKKINALLGADIQEEQMRTILSDLGFVLEGDIIHVPSWRGDVEHYSDIAEEVARFYGYNKLPTCFTAGSSNCGGYSPRQQCQRRVGELCRSMGLDEIITYSFISPSYYDKIRMPADSPLRESLRILNPLGEDTSIMRTTVLPSMLEILARNCNFRNASAALYEIGSIYLKRADGLADEPQVISMGAYGDGVDFFTVKGWVEKLAGELLRGKTLRFESEKGNASYHPGRCAKVYVDGSLWGVFGQIHPEVAKNYGVDVEMYCAELSFETLYAKLSGIPVYKPLPKFPAVTRDIAVVCDKDLTVGQLSECIMASGGRYLKKCSLFDVYTGHHIADGKKSVAFSLTMRSDDQTLTDEHAEETVKAVLDALRVKLGAVIR